MNTLKKLSELIPTHEDLDYLAVIDSIKTLVVIISDMMRANPDQDSWEYSPPEEPEPETMTETQINALISVFEMRRYTVKVKGKKKQRLVMSRMTE